MAVPNVDTLARNLVRLLNEQVKLHGELAVHMRSQLEAVRKADADQMQSITARAALLVERAAEREGLRRQLTARIVEGLGLDGTANQRIRLSELAEHFVEPLRSQLIIAASGLKRKLQEIERARITHTLVSQGMLEHLNEVFLAMTTGGQDPDVYRQDGKRRDKPSANVFEAVG